MQIFLTTKLDATLDEIHYAFAAAASKFEQNPDLVKTNQDISLHTPARKYVATLYIRGN